MSILLRPSNGFEPNMEPIPGVPPACPARELTPRRRRVSGRRSPIWLPVRPPA